MPCSSAARETRGPAVSFARTRHPAVRTGLRIRRPRLAAASRCSRFRRGNSARSSSPAWPAHHANPAHDQREFVWFQRTKTVWPIARIAMLDQVPRRRGGRGPFVDAHACHAGRRTRFTEDHAPDLASRLIEPRVAALHAVEHEAVDLMLQRTCSRARPLAAA